MRRFLVSAVALLAALALLVLWFPARWAVALAGSRLDPVALQGVHGTVWQGGADRLDWAGRPVGRLRWTLGRSALYGDVHGHVAVSGTGWQADGDIRRTGPESMRIIGLHAETPVALLRPYLATRLVPGGNLRVDLSEVSLRGDWPVRLRGTVHWTRATLDAGDGQLVLGNLHARLEDQAGTRLIAHLSDDGTGALGLHGTLDATPLGWRLDATLAARDGDDRLRTLLRRYGSLDNDGRLHLRAHGGLTMGARR